MYQNILSNYPETQLSNTPLAQYIQQAEKDKKTVKNIIQRHLTPTRLNILLKYMFTQEWEYAPKWNIEVEGIPAGLLQVRIYKEKTLLTIHHFLPREILPEYDLRNQTP